MVELIIDGKLTGVFSTDAKAREYAYKSGYSGLQVVPLGTFLATDEDEPVMNEVNYRYLVKI